MINLSHMEVKILKTQQIKTVSPHEKLSLTVLCTLIHEIAKSSSNLLDYSLFYQNIFKLLLVKTKNCEEGVFQKSIIKALFLKLLSIADGKRLLEVPALPEIKDKS